jgi:DNA-binding transcriptional LysR family regulator
LPLNSLRAFESAARQRSFSKAADELCVTHSAVSHQIKQLEEHLGTALFVRSNRGVRLTGAGETLLPVVGESFDRVAATLDGLIGPAQGGALKLTTTPSFAAKWLVPRLSR